MFDFFKKQPKEINELLERIDVAKRTVPMELEYLSSPLLDNLKSAIKTKWKQEHVDNYSRQIYSDESHEAFIYNFLIHSVADKLESGEYHIYRGALNLEGSHYKDLFEYAIDTMVNFGEYTKEWADKNLRVPVYKGIADIG